jgi:O-antigen/teichoic acid export membrane protein
MSNIRETYSGLIAFVASLITLITGLGYMLIVTRTLSILDYGTWGIINSLVVYGLIFAAIPVFQVTRATARGAHIEKTGIISSAIWSSLGLVIYFIIIFGFTDQTNVEKSILIFASILIPTNILYKIISSINIGWKPEITSYGILASQISIIPLTILLLIHFELGLTGLILSLLISICLNIVVQVYFLRKRITGIFDIKIIKKMFKFSWVPMYPKIGNILYTSDVLILFIIVGTPEIIAYYVAANVIANLVTNVSSITQGIYSKILAGGKGEIISKNITYLIFFACPLLLLSIVFAKPGITLLNPLYQEAYLLVIFLSFKLFFNMLTQIFEQFIIGNEKVDIYEKSTTKDYIKSKLITIPTLRIIQYAAYLIIFTIGVIYYMNNKTEQELLIFWVLISMFSQIPLLVLLSLKIKKMFMVKLDTVSILKYSMSGIFIFGLISIFVKGIDLTLGFLELLSQILILGIFGLGLYILISVIIDKQIRNLLKAIILEIRTRF